MRFRQRNEIILGSQSPRRKNLLKEVGVDFRVVLKDVEEIYDPALKGPEVARYLAALKGEAFAEEAVEGTVVITADTIVIHEDKVLGKPHTKEKAYEMLKDLSGSKHQVATGVALRTKDNVKIFHSTTDVYFSELTDEEIHFYIDKFVPLDKAGSYGIQEWIGYVGVEKIDGCFFNVMGLPLQPLYKELINLGVLELK